MGLFNSFCLDDKKKRDQQPDKGLWNKLNQIISLNQKIVKNCQNQVQQVPCCNTDNVICDDSINVTDLNSSEEVIKKTCVKKSHENKTKTATKEGWTKKTTTNNKKSKIYKKTSKGIIEISKQERSKIKLVSREKKGENLKLSKAVVNFDLDSTISEKCSPEIFTKVDLDQQQLQKKANPKPNPNPSTQLILRTNSQSLKRVNPVSIVSVNDTDIDLDSRGMAINDLCSNIGLDTTQHTGTLVNGYGANSTFIRPPSLAKYANGSREFGSRTRKISKESKTNINVCNNRRSHCSTNPLKLLNRAMNLTSDCRNYRQNSDKRASTVLTVNTDRLLNDDFLKIYDKECGDFADEVMHCMNDVTIGEKGTGLLQGCICGVGVFFFLFLRRLDIIYHKIIAR